MLDHIQFLHKEPDIHIPGSAVLDVKPGFVATGCISLCGSAGINRFIAEIGKSEIKYPPVGSQVGRLTAATTVYFNVFIPDDLPVLAAWFTDDDHTTDTDRIIGRWVILGTGRICL